jgi:hypothetical protein
MKPLGSDNLLVDRFDSIYRRNLVEPDAPTQNEKRRQKKLRYKMVDRIGNVCKDLHEENLKLKKRNDQREKGASDFIKDDVIII